MIPSMPETSNPKIEKWVPFLKKIVKTPDKNTYFIGHSVGCQTIIRYLENLNDEVGGSLFVGGWLKLQNLETEEEKSVAKSWLETPINFDKVRKNCKNITAVFSDNDPWVGSENHNLFEEKLNARIIIEKGRGHFTELDKVKELPIVLKEFMKMCK